MIGCGHWGKNLLRNFFNVPGGTVTRVCDSAMPRLAFVQQQYPDVRLCTAVEDVLNDPEVDGVCIATPAASHYEIAHDALMAGKHVWVEKPLALRRDEACEIRDLALRLGLVLMVDHTYIYTPALQRMKEAIDSGDIGELCYYDSVRVNLGRYYNDVNVIGDLATHDFSIVDYLLPHRPRAVSASASSPVSSAGSEGIAYVTLHFDEEFIGHSQVSWLAPGRMRRVTVCGTNQILVFDDSEPGEKLKIYDCGSDFGQYREDFQPGRVEYRIGDVSSPKLANVEPLQVAARHFIECVRYGDIPMTDGAAGARVVAMLEAAMRSHAAGGRPEDTEYDD